MSKLGRFKPALHHHSKPFSTSSRSLIQTAPRPPTAPKQTPNLSHIRKHGELYAENARLRNYERAADAPAQIAEATKDLGHILRELKPLQEEINGSEIVAFQLKEQKLKNQLFADIKRLKKEAEPLEKDKIAISERIRALGLSLPNLTSEETPKGGETKVLRYVNYDPARPPVGFEKGADHSIIGEELRLIDFASAKGVSGWGFYYLLNEGALLEQALVQYALHVARKRGWEVVTPPSLVYAHIADSCGFQPRDQNDEQQIWHVAQAEKDEGKPRLSLAATAEIPLAGMYASRTIREQDLPVRLVGSSRCYRAEAGARGVDTKGLYRVHEFTKVEMFAWTDAPKGELKTGMEVVSPSEESRRVFDEMVEVQVEILSELGLPCRVLEMPASDLGASAYRKIDIEAMFPSRLAKDEGWGEVTSASMCTDYQSRRLDTRILDPKGTKQRFPQTLNGTAVAIPRVLAALLEHGWRAKERCVVIPKVLRGYMGGMDRIVAK